MANTLPFLGYLQIHPILSLDCSGNRSRNFADCCKPEHKCPENQGACNSDEDCQNGLVCGYMMCKQPSFIRYDSCCVKGELLSCYWVSCIRVGSEVAVVCCLKNISAVGPKLTPDTKLTTLKHPLWLSTVSPKLTPDTKLTTLKHPLWLSTATLFYSCFNLSFFINTDLWKHNFW